MPDGASDSFSRSDPGSADLVISPRLLLPVAPRNEALEGASVVLRGETIIALGRREEVLGEHPGIPHLELGHHLLLPGLVNAHGHLAMTLLRGLGESESLDDWLNKTIWPLEARWMDEAFVRDGTRLAVAEMVATGTTTASDMYYFPETAALACRDVGFRLQATFPLIEMANPYSADFDECLTKGLALHDRFRDDGLVTTCFGPHSAYTVEPERLRKVAVLADEIDADVHIHLHETEDEVAGAVRSQGGTWIRVLDEVGLLTERLQAVHMTAVTDAEIDLAAERGVRIVHCPHSNMKLASGICPVTKFLASGATVGIGTDGAASNNALDMFAEARLAALLAQERERGPHRAARRRHHRHGHPRERPRHRPRRSNRLHRSRQARRPRRRRPRSSRHAAAERPPRRPRPLGCRGRASRTPSSTGDASTKTAPGTRWTSPRSLHGRANGERG